MVSSKNAAGHSRYARAEVHHEHQAPAGTPDRCNGACVSRLHGRAERLLLRGSGVPTASRGARAGVRCRTLGLERLRVGLATRVLGGGAGSSTSRPGTPATRSRAPDTSSFGPMRQMVSAGRRGWLSSCPANARLRLQVGHHFHSGLFQRGRRNTAGVFKGIVLNEIFRFTQGDFHEVSRAGGPP